MKEVHIRNPLFLIEISDYIRAVKKKEETKQEKIFINQIVMPVGKPLNVFHSTEHIDISIYLL